MCLMTRAASLSDIANILRNNEWLKETQMNRRNIHNVPIVNEKVNSDLNFVDFGSSLEETLHFFGDLSAYKDDIDLQEVGIDDSYLDSLNINKLMQSDEMKELTAFLSTTDFEHLTEDQVLTDLAPSERIHLNRIICGAVVSAVDREISVNYNNIRLSKATLVEENRTSYLWSSLFTQTVNLITKSLNRLDVSFSKMVYTFILAKANPYIRVNYTGDLYYLEQHNPAKLMVESKEHSADSLGLNYGDWEEDDPSQFREF